MNKRILILITLIFVGSLFQGTNTRLISESIRKFRHQQQGECFDPSLLMNHYQKECTNDSECCPENAQLQWKCQWLCPRFQTCANRCG